MWFKVIDIYPSVLHIDNTFKNRLIYKNSSDDPGQTIQYQDLATF